MPGDVSLERKAAQKLGKVARIRSVVQARQRKSLPRIAYEAALSTLRGRRPPGTYFSRMIHLRGANLPDYINDKDFRRIRAYADDPAVNGIFKNKALFHQHFKGSGIPLPPLLGYNIGEQFYSGSTRLDIGERTAFAEWLKDVLSHTESGAVFVKTFGGWGGAGAFRIDSPVADLDGLHRRVCSGRFLFEESLVQHPRVSEIYPHSLNTVRVMTLLNDGRVHVLSALMRFGANQNTVDNASAGGFFVAVDLETGALRPPGRRFFEYGGENFARHPDTGFELDGFLVPYWAEAMALTQAAAEHLPLKLVGWDVAITDRGPVLIEGNHTPHIHMAEIAEGGYGKLPAFRDFLEEVRGR